MPDSLRKCRLCDNYAMVGELFCADCDTALVMQRGGFSVVSAAMLKEARASVALDKAPETPSNCPLCHAPVAAEDMLCPACFLSRVDGGPETRDYRHPWQKQEGRPGE